MRKEILRTLAYADIFDYPLTAEELYRFLIANKTFPFLLLEDILKQIKQNDEQIETDGEYFFLKGRKKIVNIRQKRKKWSEQKVKIAQRVARWFKLISWVKMVGITGALAIENADENDDIDLLIVTSKNRLWLTRLLAVFLVELIASRRRPRDINVKDKICLNMFLDEEHLGVPKNEQDLFSAHEVCQLKPLWERNNCYQRFLKANLWVKKYLASSLDVKILRCKDPKKENSSNFLLSQSLNLLEYFAYKIQVAYMSSRRTSEIVEPHRIRFHPQDCRHWILKKYQEKLKKLFIV